jgi:hypothetical protein
MGPSSQGNVDPVCRAFVGGFGDRLGVRRRRRPGYRRSSSRQRRGSRRQARLEDVRNRFGDRVARVVAACSDSLADAAKGERKADWQKRKDAYLAHLDTADDDVLRVSLGPQCPRNPSRSAKTRCRRRSLGPFQPAARKKRFGTIAALPTSSAKDGPGSWLMSSSKSSRCWRMVRHKQLDADGARSWGIA